MKRKIKEIHQSFRAWGYPGNSGDQSSAHRRIDAKANSMHAGFRRSGSGAMLHRQRGYLPIPGRGNHHIICRMHELSLLGIVFPLIGHVLPILHARRTMIEQSAGDQFHLITSLRFNVFWGALLFVGLIAMFMLGPVILPIYILCLGAWMVQVLYVVHRLERGGHAWYFWFARLL